MASNRPYNAEDRAKAASRLSLIMDVRAKEIARRVLWGQDIPTIAQELGLRSKQVQWCMYRHEGFKQIMAKLEAETYEKIDQRHRDELESVRSRARIKAMAAMNTIIELMEKAPSDSLRRDCANDILEYAEVQQGKKVMAPSINLSNNQINLLVQAAKEDDDRSGNARSRTYDGGVATSAA